MSPRIQFIQMLTQGNWLTKPVNIFKKLIGIQLQDFFFTNKDQSVFHGWPLETSINRLEISAIIFHLIERINWRCVSIGRLKWDHRRQRSGSKVNEILSKIEEILGFDENHYDSMRNWSKLKQCYCKKSPWVRWERKYDKVYYLEIQYLYIYWYY